MGAKRPLRPVKINKNNKNLQTENPNDKGIGTSKMFNRLIFFKLNIFIIRLVS